MKDRLFTLAVVLFVALCSPTSWSVQNPWLGSPLGSSTVPQSSIGGGLVNTPDPIDTDGNLLITGNVRRGMHFRGNVPYQSPTSFSSTLGSSALSSFLRDTAGPEDFGSYARRYGPQPYYSATETVTTMAPGRSEVLSPGSAMVNTRFQQDARSEGTAVFGSDVSPAEPVSFTRGTAAELTVQGPQTQYHLFEESRFAREGTLPRVMSPSPRNPERLTPGWAALDREGEASAAERSQGQETVSNIQAMAADPGLGLGPGSGVSSSERQQRWSSPDTSQQYSNPGMSKENLRSGLQTQVLPASAADARQSAVAGYVERGTQYASVPQSSAFSQEGADQGQRDILERIKQQLDDLTRSVEAGLQSVSPEPAQTARTTAATKPEALRLGSQSYMSDWPGASSQKQIDSSRVSAFYMPQRDASGFGGGAVSAIADKGLADAGVEFPQTAEVARPQSGTSVLDKLDQLSPADVSTEAQRILGPHTSLESLSRTKFDEHIRAAEEHLRAGLYYRAADSFALAAVYKPDDPFVLAGQSHALFAAGEYMSSALFLSRVLAISPEYMQVKVDLADLLGGRDRVAHRLADVEQWYARSGSGQLQLLLGYVYYRTGNFAAARRAVAGAYEKMPELPAVRAIMVAIDGATR